MNHKSRKDPDEQASPPQEAGLDPTLSTARSSSIDTGHTNGVNDDVEKFVVRSFFTSPFVGVC